MPARHRHCDSAELPATDTLFEWHGKHTAAVLAANSELNWSAGQVYAIHAESPDAAFEVPGAHAVQPAPPLPVYPALHVQLLILVAPPSEDEPTGQIEHAAGPGVALNVPAYVPGGHAAQVCIVSSPALMRLTTARISGSVVGP